MMMEDYGNKSAFVQVPSDFGYYVKSRIRIANRTDINSGQYYEDCMPINISILNKFTETAFNKPFFKNPVVFLSKNSGNLNILYDYYTSLSLNGGFSLTYVKYPKNVLYLVLLKI